MNTVRKRCVYYIGGFDPKGAAHYHALYKEQAALQAAVGGLPLEVGSRKRLPTGNTAWTVRSRAAGSDVNTWYEFMRWDDIVRQHWHRHLWKLWCDILITSVFYLRTGTLWRMFLLRWPPAVALLVPAALLIAALLGVPLIAAGVGVSTALAWDKGWIGIAAAVATAGLLLWGASHAQARWSMYWMMRSYVLTHLQATGRAPELEQRLNQLAQQLAQRLREGGDDEVLVIGHSSGAIMACSVVSRALALNGDKPPSPRLSLLTLGQCIPMLGLVPQAHGFREELARLATATQLDWIDFSAPPDGSCFALCDPIDGCQVRAPSRKSNRPKMLSPRFAQMFDASTYHLLRKDKLRLHFQYLRAAAHPGKYDYFRITAGDMTLADRFADHPGLESYRELRPFARR